MKITQSQINEIAGLLEAGMNVYLNPLTYEMEFLPNQTHNPMNDEEAWQEVYDKVDKVWESFKLIEPADSKISYLIMEAFVDTVPDKKLRARLTTALNRSKPFHNFKYEIDYSGEYREKWFAFKRQSLIDYVKEELDRMEIDYDRE